jgi:crotonobetainyl-CoA:carnitine CoA-transferase CaiB-like acyl-CoA transferase
MLALEGMKVLDLSRVLAGPWCTQTLADLGAEVWKIEPPGQGDDTRSWMPPELGGESTYFICCNRSKRSVALNLRHPDAQDLARELAMQADVLVENFRKGALDRFGLGYDSLARLNPRLIYCSISGYGRTGPRAEEPGYDFAIQAESGLMAITGEPDGEPMKLGVAITDIVTGMNAVQAILAAVIARGHTGRGQLIDLSLLDGAVSVLANVASGHLATGAKSVRYGNAHATVVPYQLFDTVDGVIALAIGNDLQFRTFCKRVIDRPELADDARFRRNRDRVKNRDVLIPILKEILHGRSTAEWIGLLKANGIPAGEVRGVHEALASPEISARGLVTAIPDAHQGGLRIMCSPLALRGTPPRQPIAPPRLGEHTASVLREVLKLSETRIHELAECGAISLMHPVQITQ